MFTRTREAAIDAILQHFLRMRNGQTTTYAELSKIIGERVGASHYPVRKAIQLARDKHAVMIRNERGVGFARTATFDERRDMLDSRRGKVRRQALTGLKETAAAMRASNVSNAQMLELTRYQGAFGVAHMATGGSQSAAKKIAGELFVEPRPSRKDIPA